MTVKEVSDGGHRCSNCESTFKVNEVAPGLFICSGECFKIYSKHATCRNAGEGVASSKVGGGHTGNHHVEDDFGNRAVPPGDDNLKETNGGRITNGGCEPKHVEPKQREHAFTGGDFCRAVFSDDGIEYEAVVGDVTETDDGKRFAEIEYLGYGNSEVQWIEDLKPSLGAEAREKQVYKSKVFADGDGDTEAEAQTELVEGDFCRAVFDEDNLEYEGVLGEIHVDANGRSYALITFVGYENCETHWVDQLKPSLGQAARDAQTRDAQETQAPEDGGEGVGEALDVEGVEASEQGEDEVNDASPALKHVDGDPNGTPFQHEENGACPAQEFNTSDFCRAVNDNGCEYEALILNVKEQEDGRWAEVKFIGSDKTGFCRLDELKKSLGPESRARQQIHDLNEAPPPAETLTMPGVAGAGDCSESFGDDVTREQSNKIRELTKRLDAVSNFNRELVKMTSKEADDNAVQMAAKIEESNRTIQNLKLRIQELENESSEQATNYKTLIAKTEELTQDNKKLIAKLEACKKEVSVLKNKLRDANDSSVADADGGGSTDYLVRSPFQNINASPSNGVMPFPMMFQSPTDVNTTPMGPMMVCPVMMMMSPSGLSKQQTASNPAFQAEAPQRGAK